MFVTRLFFSGTLVFFRHAGCALEIFTLRSLLVICSKYLAETWLGSPGGPGGAVAAANFLLARLRLEADCAELALADASVTAAFSAGRLRPVSYVPIGVVEKAS